MKRPTQKDRVKKHLIETGEVTNLWAIENHMLRLGAIIHSIRQDGWEIEADFIEGTKNYRYRLVKRNEVKTRYETFEVDGRRIVRPVRYVV